MTIFSCQPRSVFLKCHTFIAHLYSVFIPARRRIEAQEVSVQSKILDRTKQLYWRANFKTSPFVSDLRLPARVCAQTGATHRSGTNFNPQKTQCIPAVKIFGFLNIKQN
jgi:hypothetical protein